MILHLRKPDLSAHIAIQALTSFSQTYAQRYRDKEAPEAMQALEALYKEFIKEHGEAFGILASREAIREYAENRKTGEMSDCPTPC